VAGILDEEEDLSIDDLFNEPIPEPSEDDKKAAAEEEKAKAKAEDDRRAKELADMKAELAELKSQRFAGFHQPAPSAQDEHKPKPLKDRIQDRLAATGDIAEAINMAAEEAYNAGQLNSKAQYIPIAAQAAKYAISKFIDDNPMTTSVRKEFDKIVNETSDEVFASFSPQQLLSAIETAADVAEGKVIRKTKTSRGAEPPAYSAGSGGSFGRESTQAAKPKMSKEKVQEMRQMAELAASCGMNKKEVEEMLGGFN
jgi:hypothetical protein